MSDIHYIKIIARNRNINPMKNDTLSKGIIQVSLVGLVDIFHGDADF